MPYAVVKFPIDNMIGVICTKWMTSDEKHCFYPASKSDLFNMTVILKREKDALPGWDKHAIVILGRYATYADAKKYESKAEDTSNLSEDDEEIAGKRKRRPNTKYEDSDDEDSPSPPLKKSKIPEHPSLLSFARVPSNTSPLQEISTNNLQSNQPETRICNSPSLYQSYPMNSPSILNQSDSDTDLENISVQSPKSIFSLPSPPHSLAQFKTPPPKKNNYRSAFSPPIHNHPYAEMTRDCSSSGISGILSQREFSSSSQNHQQKSTEHSKVMDKLNHLVQMVSALNERVDQLSQQVNQMGERQMIGQPDKGEEVIALLPIKSTDDFDNFEKRLAEEETFRKSLVKAMSTLGGRDPHIFVMNALKFFITDKAAEHFSLTGKQMGKIPAKRKFTDTRACNCIFDAVKRRYREATNETIKNTIKNWLQQATPRIQKREKRQEAGTREVEDHA